MLASTPKTIQVLSITPLPYIRVLVGVFMPEHAFDGAQLGTLVEYLGWLGPFGLSGAKVLECKLCVFKSAKVDSEAPKFAGTSNGLAQLMPRIMAWERRASPSP
jgi:hypothetical protein